VKVGPREGALAIGGKRDRGPRDGGGRDRGPRDQAAQRADGCGRGSGPEDVGYREGGCPAKSALAKPRKAPRVRGVANA